MTVHKVLKMGDPRLFERSREIEDINAPEIKQLLEDMWDTMRALNGAGLAAPQIGISKRLVIFGFDHNPRYPEAEAIETTVLINPIIEVLDDQQQQDWEGCLSLPGLRGRVPRYRKIRYRGQDDRGQTIDRVATGFHARVVQHEVDHLDGVLYPMRMPDMKNFGFEHELFPELYGAS